MLKLQQLTNTMNINQLRKQNAILLKALHFYADESNWSESTWIERETGEMPNADGWTDTIDIEIIVGVPTNWCYSDNGFEIAQQAIALVESQPTSPGNRSRNTEDT